MGKNSSNTYSRIALLDGGNNCSEGVIQKKVLRFVLDDQTSDHVELLETSNVPGMKIMALRYLAIEVYKCANDINHTHHDILLQRDVNMNYVMFPENTAIESKHLTMAKYELCNVSIAYSTRAQTTNHGLNHLESMI